MSQQSKSSYSHLAVEGAESPIPSGTKPGSPSYYVVAPLLEPKMLGLEFTLSSLCLAYPRPTFQITEGHVALNHH